MWKILRNRFFRDIKVKVFEIWLNIEIRMRPICTYGCFVEKKQIIDFPWLLMGTLRALHRKIKGSDVNLKKIEEDINVVLFSDFQIISLLFQGKFFSVNIFFSFLDFIFFPHLKDYRQWHALYIHIFVIYIHIFVIIVCSSLATLPSLAAQDLFSIN